MSVRDRSVSGEGGVWAVRYRIWDSKSPRNPRRFFPVLARSLSVYCPNPHRLPPTQTADLGTDVNYGEFEGLISPLRVRQLLHLDKTPRPQGLHRALLGTVISRRRLRRQLSERVCCSNPSRKLRDSISRRFSTNKFFVFRTLVTANCI